MIARFFRLLWCAILLAMGASAALAVHRLGPAIGPGFAALLGVLPWLLLHPAAIIGNYAASRLYGDPVPPTDRLSFGEALRMLDREIDASVLGVWFANPFLAGRRAPLAATTSNRPAILFVHGYLCNRAVWHPFMRDAARRGYRCEAITLTDPFGPIGHHAPAIDAAITALSRSGAAVFVVAHSMGGLVVRSALRTIDRSRIAHVVTLGSPHHGTWSARFGHGAALRQMRRDSEWLAELAADEAAGRGLSRDALTSIYSRHDDIVYPQATAHLEGAENIPVTGCGHVNLLYDADVGNIVFDRLERWQVAQEATS